MKDQSQAAIQFSGYPLTIADKEKLKSLAILTIVVSKESKDALVEKEAIGDNPKNWDVNWFNNYE